MRFINLIMVVSFFISHHIHSMDHDSINIFKTLSGSVIHSIDTCGIVAKVVLHDKNNASILHVVYCIQQIHNSILYLTPLGSVPGKSTPDIANDYCLLLSVDWGQKYQQSVEKALQDNADLNAHDARLTDMLFTLETAQGKTCTYKEFKAKQFHYFAESKRPLIYALPYSDTRNYTALDHAARRMDVTTLRRLIQQNLTLPKIIPFIDIHALELQYANEQTELQRTQHESNSFTITQFATAVAHLIGTQAEGIEFITEYTTWKHLQLFKYYLLRQVIDMMVDESYCDQNLLAQNLISFAETIVTDFCFEESDLYTLNAQHFCALLLSLCASKCHNLENDLFSAQWNFWYQRLTHKLLRAPHTTKFLRKLCTDNAKNLLGTTLRCLIQIDLLRTYLVRLLTHRGSLFIKDIAQHIASYWQPDEMFKTYIRTRYLLSPS